jgi:hypothetical protein
LTYKNSEDEDEEEDEDEDEGENDDEDEPAAVTQSWLLTQRETLTGPSTRLFRGGATQMTDDEEVRVALATAAPNLQERLPIESTPIIIPLFLFLSLAKLSSKSLPVNVTSVPPTIDPCWGKMPTIVGLTW